MKDSVAVSEKERDEYSHLKLKQRRLTFLEIQEEYIKDEVKNLKRELLRSQEEVRAHSEFFQSSLPSSALRLSLCPSLFSRLGSTNPVSPARNWAVSGND